VAAATSEQISNPGEANPDWRQGYGYQFWMSRHGYRGDGAFGQFCVILPEQDTVIVTTACTTDMQAVLDAMWAHLLPGIGTVCADAGSAHDQLSARLAHLELPACPGAPAPADWRPWTSGPFTIATSTPGTQVQPFLTSIEVAPRAGGWQISLIEPANTLTFPVGTGDWTISDHAGRHGETIPVAASGGWLDGHTLRAEVIFLETPHRMDITCTLPGRTAQAVWRHPPLNPSKLQHLHCPA
jgi:CubicO group peptidase (beta-lactamase class C family)